MGNKNKELLSFNRNMLLQCAVQFLIICAGLWINIYCFFIAVGFTVAVSIFGEIKNTYYHLLFCLLFQWCLSYLRLQPRYSPKTFWKSSHCKGLIRYKCNCNEYLELIGGVFYD